MRYIGIDFGSKRVGVAVSDESNRFAFPNTVLTNDVTLVEEIKKICTTHDVGEIVVGESNDFSQKENDVMILIRPFIESLKTELRLPVHLHPEFMTSEEAKQLQGENAMLDASAAAIILKSYLDTFKNKNHDHD